MVDEAGARMTAGVVGDEPRRAVDAFDAAGARTIVDGPQAALEAGPDVAVAVGESALLALARARPSVPVLPVDAGDGVRSVPRERLDDAAGRVVEGDWRTETHPLVAVDGRSLAFMDAMLVTAEPAHISEFTVTAGEDRVARFRADGVVVATPAGTCGYARAAGTPVVPPTASALAVAPIAPFATTLDHWVVPVEDVTVTVERDDAVVEVLADDRTVGEAPAGSPVELSPAGAVSTIRVPEGRSPFAGHGGQLEKL